MEHLAKALKLKGDDLRAFTRAAHDITPLRADWGDAPSPEGFCGRARELAELESHLLDRRCRIVAIVGMGGMGKTQLAARLRLSEKIAAEFECILWRGLMVPSTAQRFFQQAPRFLADQQQLALPDPEDLEEHISLLLWWLREKRCLLVLDHVSALLQSGRNNGRWHEDFRAYERLIERIGNEQHSSCLLLTSQELPAQLAHLDGATRPIRIMRVQGVAPHEARGMLRHKQLTGAEAAWAALTERYAGNPLWLAIISSRIHTFHGGDIARFLQDEREGIPAGIHDLMNRHVARLAPREREIMYWLALEREPVSRDDLWEHLADRPAPAEVSSALDALLSRSLIEIRGQTSFTLQPTIMEYLVETFIERAYHEIHSGSLDLLKRHALLRAQAKDYVSDDLARLILRPLRDRLLRTYGRDGLIHRLQQLLQEMRVSQPGIPGYAAANLLHLLLDLECDLTGYDLSGLSIWQARLQGSRLRAVSFRDCDLSGTTFTQTFGGVRGVAVSPDGRYLVAGGTSDDVRVWGAKTFQPLALGHGHEDWIWSVAFRPNGAVLATGSDDGTVRLWDPSTGMCQQTLKGHTRPTRAVAFSPDGLLLASGSFDRTVRVWSLRTGAPLRILRGHRNDIRAVAFSPDGALLASAGDDHTIRLWNPATGACVHRLEEHTGNVWSVAFSPDGALLASASEDHTIRLWDPTSGARRGLLESHTDDVWSVAFSPDGALLASGGYDHKVRVWNPTTGACLRTLDGHTNHVCSVTFSPDGTQVISGSEDQTVRIWDHKTGLCLKSITGHAERTRGVAFSPDGAILASAGDDGLVRLWDPRTETYLKSLDDHTSSMRAVAFSPDGTLLASGGADRRVRLWEAVSGTCLRSLPGHEDWIWSVAFNPDGTLLASASDDRTIRLWNPRGNECLGILEGHTGHVRSLAFSPDGALLASASDDRTVRLWSLGAKPYRALGLLRGYTNHVRGVAFSPDGALLASAGDDRAIRLWDPLTRKCVRTLRRHTGNVWSVAFSTDGTLLASGGEDRTVRLWNPHTGQELGTLDGRLNHIWSVAFSPDQEVLAAGGEDGHIHLWHLTSRAYRNALAHDKPYERMNIAGASGLSAADRAGLRALGALEA